MAENNRCFCEFFRCGIDRLVTRLKELGQNPFADAMYVFCSRSKNRLKLLYWGGAGFYLILYRLESGKFRWFRETDIRTITYKQMEWLLDGNRASFRIKPGMVSLN